MRPISGKERVARSGLSRWCRLHRGGGHLKRSIGNIKEKIKGKKGKINKKNVRNEEKKKKRKKQRKDRKKEKNRQGTRWYETQHGGDCLSGAASVEVGDQQDGMGKSKKHRQKKQRRK